MVEEVGIMDIGNLFIPDDLGYYLDVVSEKLSEEGVLTVSITLTQEQCAAILQAHDYGIAHVTPDSERQINTVMSSIKDAIWP